MSWEAFGVGTGPDGCIQRHFVIGKRANVKALSNAATDAYHGVILQQKLVVAGDVLTSIAKRLNAPDGVTGTDKHAFFAKEILNVWPIEGDVLRRCNDRVVAQTEIGCAQADRLEPATGGHIAISGPKHALVRAVLS